jgi:Fic family protein
MKYIWQQEEWPALRWRIASLLPLISQARLIQGKFLSHVESLGFGLEKEARAEVLVEETVKTSAIEGETLNRETVRSSVARRLGLPSAGLSRPDRAVDGLVEVLLEATMKFDQPLTAARIKRWQAALFPGGYSGLTKIRVGKWRGSQPMQVLSGPIGHEKIHYEAPPGVRAEKEMKRFLSWWKASPGREDGLIRAGLAHFYFVTIHPFEDGNGRLARVLTDMALAQDENLSTRYYSLSSQIMAEREEYYRVLEKGQKGDGEITEWLAWFLGCYRRAVEGAEQLMTTALNKARFWRDHAATELNERQRKVINRLLDAGPGGFQGGLTTRKYGSLVKTSRVTAYREIADLLEKGLLKQNPSKGRSTSYDLKY